jgi:hypothetical protein
MADSPATTKGIDSPATPKGAPYDRTPSSSSPNRHSLFRGFFLGMNEVEFLDTVSRQKKDFVIRLSHSAIGSYASVKVYEKGTKVGLVPSLTKFEVNDQAELYAEVEISPELVINCIRTHDPGPNHYESHGNTGEYVYENLRELPQFKITTMIFLPRFFDANGMKINEFGQELIAQFRFAQNTLFPGLEKGIRCACYVGLLASGEKVELSTGLAAIIVTNSDEEFARKFQSIKPKF